MDNESDVLIVDDEYMNVFCLSGQLKGLGIKSDTTMISTEALSIFEDRIAKVVARKADMYKLCLLDYSMPEMDGLELV